MPKRAQPLVNNAVQPRCLGTHDVPTNRTQRSVAIASGSTRAAIRGGRPGATGPRFLRLHTRPPSTRQHRPPHGRREGKGERSRPQQLLREPFPSGPRQRPGPALTEEEVGVHGVEEHPPRAPTPPGSPRTVPRRCSRCR